MIADQNFSSIALRLSAWGTWKTPQRRQRKLIAFACAEKGSALDMLEAAKRHHELPLKKLFARHAMDELRHAKMFLAAAQEQGPLDLIAVQSLNRVRSDGLYIHFEVLEFLAFVHLAEIQGERHFRTLSQHLKCPRLVRLFDNLAHDERHHVDYSLAELSRRVPDAKKRSLILLKVRSRMLFWAWRRAGRSVGVALSAIVLNTIFYLFVSILARFVSKRDAPQWQKSLRHLDLRRQW